MKTPLALLPAIVLTACAGTPKNAEKPSVKLGDVALTELSFTEARGTLDVQVFNPNAFALPLEKMDWKMSVEGSSFLEGHVQLGKSIPARTSAPVQSKINFGASNAMTLARILGEGADDYTLHAVLHFKGPNGPVKATAMLNGTFPKTSLELAMKE